jgi:hypothetical protein
VLIQQAIIHGSLALINKDAAKLIRTSFGAATTTASGEDKETGERGESLTNILLFFVLAINQPCNGDTPIRGTLVTEYRPRSKKTTTVKHRVWLLTGCRP